MLPLRRLAKKSFLRPGALSLIAMLFVMVFVASSFEAIANTLADLRQQRDNIQLDIRRAREYLAEIDVLRNSTLYEIVQLDIQLDEVNEAYFQVSQDLAETNIRLNMLNNDLYAAEIRREIQFNALLSRLRFMHENSHITYIELLLAADNIGDFLNNMEHIRQIIEHDNNILEGFLETEAAIAAYRNEVAIRQAEISVLSQDLAALYAALTEIIADRHELIAHLGDEEQAHLELITMWNEAEQEIQMSIARMEAEANRIAAQRRGQTQGRITQAANAGPMLWPVDGARGVNSHYGNRPSPFTGRTEFHTGVDLRAPHGTNLLAAESGVVITSGYMRGFGNTVIIDHGDGLTTLYAHNSRNLVAVGDWVERGDVIARAGATGLATGSHLHFEVRETGRHIDPQPFLGY